MTDSKKSALELLEELRSERDELNVLIQALEKRLGISASASVSSGDEKEEPTGSLPPLSPTTSLPMGFFHNLSQASAAEKLLKLNPGQTYKTGEILEAFKNSGMPLNPKNSVQILYTALKRSPKFERIGNKAWGLREWYPEKKRRQRDESLSEKSLEDET